MQPVTQPDSASSADEIRVLVLEESERDAGPLLLRRAQCGRRIVHERVHTPEALKQALLAADWDIVLSDRAVPGLSPRPALGILKSTGCDIPLVVCSAAECVEATAAGDRASRHGARERRAGRRAVTGLATRAQFLQRAPRALAACGANEHAVVCFIDVAHFGLVDAGFGRPTGDALLGQIGARLRDHAKNGLAAYLGEDEFLVLQGGFGNEDDIHRYVQDLSTILAEPYTRGGLELHVACDMGVSAFPSGGRSLSELVLNAQTALHQCKRLMGRNAYIFYFPELNPARGDAVLLGSALSQALGRNELRLCYQPCVSLSTGHVTSVEALVRWQHPELGLLASERFIPLAADCGLIGDIDAWVLREATRQASVWRAAGHAFAVTMNVSASEFAHPRFLGRAAIALREARLDTSALEIEITESALVQDTSASLATLQALRKMGVRVAIDDFGTGYSSLAYLKRFPVDILKIDKSFVKNIAVDPADAAIAQTIIALARNLGLDVQAEGVETQEQLELLRRYGCGRAQGHLFARPVPAEELVSVVRRIEAAAPEPAM